jgi:hypothetical protein
MVKEEGGTVTVSLYEDLPAATTTTTIETPAIAEEKEADIKAHVEKTTTNAEQSKEERTTEVASK